MTAQADSADETSSLLPPKSRIRPYVYCDKSTEYEDSARFYRSKDRHSNSATDQNENESKGKASFLSFSRRTKLILVFCASVVFLSSCAFSLIGPFFPQVAARKGMSLTITGFVFSSFQLVEFIASPIVGTYLTKIGPKFIFLSGIFLAGGASILFGFLIKCPNGWIFILMCILSRSVMALGCAQYMTASYAIVSYQCEKAIGIGFAILSTAGGVGFMVGPAIGGVLYSVGGFGLPFFLLGSLVLLNGIVIYKFLPSMEVEPPKKRGSVLSLLRSPMICLAITCLTVCRAAIASYDSTFSTHLAEYNLSILDISLMFVIPTGLYSLSAPVWGWISDNKQVHAQLIIFGLIFYAVSWILAGPSILFPFLPHKLIIVMTGVSILGVINGAVVIPCMRCVVKGAHELGYENSLNTCSLTSGLMTAFRSLGGFVGPIAGGAIVQEWGYPIGYTVWAGLSVLLAIFTLIYFACRGFKVEQPADTKKTIGKTKAVSIEDDQV